MRIAITTWHTGQNTGTFFQLYGLYKYLEGRGHSVKVIDYPHQPNDSLPRGIMYFLHQPLGLVRRKLKQRAFDKKYAGADKAYADQIAACEEAFRQAYKALDFTDVVVSDADFAKLNDEFDAFVVGSDQIWNASMLNRRYFLDYVAPGKIKASYCPSMGTALVLKRQKQQYKQYLDSFDYISVRERLLKTILDDVLQRPVYHLLDPSMLYPKEEYLAKAELPKQLENCRYLLCYFMPRDERQKAYVKRYAKEHNLKLVQMAMFLNDYTMTDAEIICPTPWQFLGLIANAATVFTSSFHCTIFSIMFNKDLYVFEQPHTSKSSDINQRYIEQLETYGISHRYIRWGEEIQPANTLPINYDEVNRIFNARLKESKEFLNQFA